MRKALFLTLTLLLFSMACDRQTDEVHLINSLVNQAKLEMKASGRLPDTDLISFADTNSLAASLLNPEVNSECPNEKDLAMTTIKFQAKGVKPGEVSPLHSHRQP